MSSILCCFFGDVVVYTNYRHDVYVYDVSVTVSECSVTSQSATFQLDHDYLFEKKPGHVKPDTENVSADPRNRGTSVNVTGPEYMVEFRRLLRHSVTNSLK